MLYLPSSTYDPRLFDFITHVKIVAEFLPKRLWYFTVRQEMQLSQYEIIVRAAKILLKVYFYKVYLGLCAHE